MPDEYHVASFVVYTRPDCESLVAAEIADLAGIEVHAQTRGKLVVTAESGHVGDLADLASRLGEPANVLSVAPVYHQFTSESESEEIDSNEHQ